MASFYGRGGASTGGSGTSNYNELSNKPIANLTGLTAINLSTLTLGLYNVRGNYIYNADDKEVKSFASATFVKVLLDSVSGDKIVTFDVYENSKHLTISIDYFVDGSYKVDRYTYEVISSVSGTTEDLPEAGDATKLYATDEGLYVWNEQAQEYIQLGTEAEAADQTWDEM
jgi:hypothetical protein